MCYGPLAFGLLADPAASWDSLTDWRGGNCDLSDPWFAANYPRFFRDGSQRTHAGRVKALGQIAEREGHKLPDLALAWVLAQPGVTAVAAGTRSIEHATTNAQAAELDLADTTLAALLSVVE
jgi:aryl-alcohol dehydrogenase-like predicted oxidoreductase